MPGCEDRYGCEINFKKFWCTDENRERLLEDFQCKPYDEEEFSQLKHYERERYKIRLYDEAGLFEQIKEGHLKDETVSTVYYDLDMDRPIAYVAINCTGIMTSNDVKRSLFHVGRAVIPAVEIKYFAVDCRYRGILYSADAEETFSEFILYNVMDDITELTNTIIGASEIVLYSVPAAIHFYKKCGFESFKKSNEKAQNKKTRGKGKIRFGNEDIFSSNCVPLFRKIKRD